MNDEDFLSICYYRNNPSAEEDEDDYNEKRLRLVRLLKAIIDNELTDTERDTVYKKYFENLSVTDIAADYGINPSSVSRTLSRAEKKIRSYMRYVMYALNGTFSSQIFQGRYQNDT
ncbi:MAG: sigma-70 family RNA polymerase sigma factor [Clostridia bacterium]|nr:sigma-70 family RNA polymerase sigma factor [Clostridia bacterium]